jgi:hypothetical protein
MTALHRQSVQRWGFVALIVDALGYLAHNIWIGHLHNFPVSAVVVRSDAYQGYTGFALSAIALALLLFGSGLTRILSGLAACILGYLWFCLLAYLAMVR